jgi:hemoglobin
VERAAIEESEIRLLVDRFYGRVREDALLGPIFASAVGDWPEHLARLCDFWSSVMLTSGRYKGSPVATHLRYAPALTAAAFERWLALWRITTSELLEADVAAALQAKAGRIAESLHLAVVHRPSTHLTH